MSKPLTIFDTAEQWCDYELMGTVAHLLEQDGRSVHIPAMSFGSIYLTTPAGGFTSLKDLAAMMRHIADHLEDTRMYKGDSDFFMGVEDK